jgi:hypothetical protein
MRKLEAHFFRRRRMLRRLVWGGALATMDTLGLLRVALAANPQSGMRSIKGNVTIDGQPAMLGQPIRAGQQVVTESGSEAVFVIGEDAFLQRENSTFAIEDGAGVVVVRYITGKILSVFGKGRKQLVTPTATIGIRGTACYIEAEQERTYFCLCYGKAVIQPNANPRVEKKLWTTHHERPVYIGNGSGNSIVQANIDNHTDAELIMLEELVGRLPPFYGKAGNTY